MVANITMPDNNMNDPFTLTSRIREQETFLTSVLGNKSDIDFNILFSPIEYLFELFECDFKSDSK